MFIDPWNPTISEIHQWAYTPEAMEPCQDWDLSLSWSGHNRDYVNFAADAKRPKADFFLRVLYLMIGDAVRSKFSAASEDDALALIALAKGSASPTVRLWRERAIHLMKHPEEFEYEAWCCGQLARQQ